MDGPNNNYFHVEFVFNNCMNHILHIHNYDITNTFIIYNNVPNIAIAIMINQLIKYLHYWKVLSQICTDNSVKEDYDNTIHFVDSAQF